MYMKRLNPKTNQPFKRGDVREDGKVFFNYTNLVKANGFFTERWISAEASEKAMKSDRDRKKAKHVRKSARLPKNYAKEICNNDPELIYAFKNAWEEKYTNGATKEDLEWVLDCYPELHQYFFDKE